MQDFVIRFFISNLFIAGFVCLIMAAKQVFRKHLSSRSQYNIWLFLFGALAIPFLPVRQIRFPQLLTLFFSADSKSMSEAAGKSAALFGQIRMPVTADTVHDFSVSVSRNVPSVLGLCLFIVWTLGMSVMLLLLLKSRLSLYRLERSALLLQNPEVQNIFDNCLSELNIRRHIKIYSTAYLKSPVTIGFIRPRVYLPVHLIADFETSEMRYMLLHELQHYKHGDAWIGCLVNLASIFYWFNPIVHWALKRILDDRELACDCAVLEMLDETEYYNYGNTLIHFAEKVSALASPFVSGIAGDRNQIKQRILNIASYRPLTRYKRLKSVLVYLLTAVLFIGLVPVFSVYAAQKDHYRPPQKESQTSSANLSAYFADTNGSFVLYDTKADTWEIYNQELASKRISPDSTYKIYSALIGLESGSITPESSDMIWDGTNYPFDEWMTDQTLTTAMQNSVNWYFQNLDRQTGEGIVKSYLHQFEYGNEDISAGVDTCWLESSLKISPLEQVELLKKVLTNEFHLQETTIKTVKDTLLVSTSNSVRLYGKTGTGAVNGMEINGWFVGFVETPDNTYIFTVNVQNDSDANGSLAKDIAFSILRDYNIL